MRLNRLFFGHRNLGLRDDPASRFLPWVLCLTVYVSSVAVALLIAFQFAVAEWRTAGYAATTVEFPADTDTATLARALDLVRATAGITAAAPVADDQLLALLEPWFDGDTLPAGLPLPRLIDVTASDADTDWAALEAALKEIDGRAAVDRGRAWIDPLIEAARVLQAIAALVLALVLAVAVTAVVFATRAGLTIHKDSILLMHLLGAEDGFIAAEFQGQAVRLALRGGALGLALAALTMAVAYWPLTGLQGPIMAGLTLGWIGIAIVLALPVLGAALAMITARATAMRKLTALN